MVETLVPFYDNDLLINQEVGKGKSIFNAIVNQMAVLKSKFPSEANLIATVDRQNGKAKTMLILIAEKYS